MVPELLVEVISLIAVIALGAPLVFAFYSLGMMIIAFPWKKRFPLALVLPMVLVPRFHDTELGRQWCRRFRNAVLLTVCSALVIAVPAINHILESQPDFDIATTDVPSLETLPNWSAASDAMLYGIIPSIIAAFVIIGIILGVRSIHEYLLRR